jgi:hypothetical protein
MLGLFSVESNNLTPADERFLREFTIGEDSPGTILRDFESLLDYVAAEQLRPTGTGQLPMRSLSEINARLTRSIELGLTRPVQKSFPPIHGLYLLARASGLVQIGKVGKKTQLVVAEEIRRRWSALNPTERYGTLLETWLLHGKPEIIGEHSRPYHSLPRNFENWALFMSSVPYDRAVQTRDTRDFDDMLSFSPGWHNLGLLDLFGILEVIPADPEPGERWQIARINRTQFGQAILHLLARRFFNDFDRILDIEAMDEIPFGLFQPLFEPYFPEWQRTLTLPEWTFRDGTYVFKASLGRTWRRIAVPAAYSLESLAIEIINSVGFSHDHLYQFSFPDARGALRLYTHAYMDNGVSVSEIAIGELPIAVGQSMDFLYDFGDQWEFDVTLEAVDTDMELKAPTVLQEHGESPEQYPTWGDDEDW